MAVSDKNRKPGHWPGFFAFCNRSFIRASFSSKSFSRISLGHNAIALHATVAIGSNNLSRFESLADRNGLDLGILFEGLEVAVIEFSRKEAMAY